MSRQLISGAQALAEAALRAGCRYCFGGPPGSLSPAAEYLAARLPGMGGVLVPSHSAQAAISMVMGAAMAGARALTFSSGPGLSRMQEGLSWLAGLELPAVVANFSQGGPGPGNLHPTQSDYFQATRGGGHGDYRTLVLAPASCQEMADLTVKAFALADAYRNPVLILADALLAQLIEPVELPPALAPSVLPAKDWALGQGLERPRRCLALRQPRPKLLENHNYKLVRKYDAITRDQIAWQGFALEDARLLVVAFGSAARIAKGAVKRVRERGLKVGLWRPITLWPFPSQPLRELTRVVRHLLVVEMSAGQMVEDVRLAVQGQATVELYGRPGGVVPTPDQAAHEISHYYHQAHLQRLGRRRGGGA
ncbi:MAG: 3-methyl-2-oxobutanoate dehydrogenase subunit VorB [Desulfarculus sp.]|nr:MAG: 3-methyl-2-oxobutanoate dehydrogenase subunit VorB [Desulfarculus sp.]